MERSTWKAIERDWAARLGGTRVPVTGRQRGNAPDVAHERFAVEIKTGRVMSPRMQDAVAQAVACARDGQIPLVGITQAVGRGHQNQHYVLMRWDDFRKLLNLNQD
jgi:hypothetical protein